MEVLDKDHHAPPRVEKLDDKRLGLPCLAGLIEDVRADEQRAASLGITGVPFYAIDEQYGVSGAQDPAAFLGISWYRKHFSVDSAY